MHLRLVIPLAAIGDGDAAEVGAKAWNLARMLRAGLPVPEGFCVTATAYRQHVLTDAPRQAAVSAALAREIQQQLDTLGDTPLAVRSSATAEDLPDHSFAGQHDSFLGVRRADCLERIGQCWASLWNERAYAYRQERGYESTDCAMAVVVQEMVPARASGVMFSVDPMRGDSDRIIIEATWGLGEGLVGGPSGQRFQQHARFLRIGHERTVFLGEELHIGIGIRGGEDAVD